MTIKQNIAFFYLNSKAEAIINESDTDHVCESMYTKLYQTSKNL